MGDTTLTADKPPLPVGRPHRKVGRRRHDILLGQPHNRQHRLQPPGRAVHQPDRAPRIITPNPTGCSRDPDEDAVPRLHHAHPAGPVHPARRGHQLGPRDRRVPRRVGHRLGLGRRVVSAPAGQLRAGRRPPGRGLRAQGDPDGGQPVVDPLGHRGRLFDEPRVHVLHARAVRGWRWLDGAEHCRANWRHVSAGQEEESGHGALRCHGTRGRGGAVRSLRP
ncbi:hypothetical protein VTK56DRAFT_813 [Thermocarpiscus australiensis]